MEAWERQQADLCRRNREHLQALRREAPEVPFVRIQIRMRIDGLDGCMQPVTSREQPAECFEFQVLSAAEMALPCALQDTLQNLMRRALARMDTLLCAECEAPHQELHLFRGVERCITCHVNAKGETFYRETDIWPPGRDMPAAMGGDDIDSTERLRRYHQWCEEQSSAGAFSAPWPSAQEDVGGNPVKSPST